MYLAGVTRAVEHVFDHLDDEVSPQVVAQEACFSIFHFHRIFRGMMGESICDFIKRIRLERAAWRLIQGASVTDTAFDAGFGSHAAFTRAFHERFGSSPSEFRGRHIQVFELQNPTGLHYDPQGRPPIVRPLKGDQMMDVEIRTQPAIRTAALDHRGPYWQIGQAFAELCRWAEAAGVPLREGGAIRPRSLYGIYYDCPDESPAAELRSDACVAIPDDFAIAEGPVREVVIPAGTYAVATYVGPYSGMGDGWARFMGQFLPQTGREPGEGFNFECYVDDCDVAPVDQLRTELCVPVQA